MELASEHGNMRSLMILTHLHMTWNECVHLPAKGTYCPQKNILRSKFRIQRIMSK